MWEQVNCRRQTEAAQTSVTNFARWSRRVHLVGLWRWKHSVEKKWYIPRTKTAAPYSVSRGGKILSLHNIRAIWPKSIVYSERRSPALWTIYGAVHLWRVANCTNYSSRINKNKKHNKWDLWKRSVSWNPKSGATVQKKTANIYPFTFRLWTRLSLQRVFVRAVDVMRDSFPGKDGTARVRMFHVWLMKKEL